MVAALSDEWTSLYCLCVEIFTDLQRLDVDVGSRGEMNIFSTSEHLFMIEVDILNDGRIRHSSDIFNDLSRTPCYHGHREYYLKEDTIENTMLS